MHARLLLLPGFRTECTRHHLPVQAEAQRFVEERNKREERLQERADELERKRLKVSAEGDGVVWRVSETASE